MNRLIDLKKHGQSFWPDYIRRSFLTSGDFKRLMMNTGLVASPAIDDF